MIEGEPRLHRRWAFFDPGSIRNFPETSALGPMPLIPALLRLTTVSPKVVASGPITLNQRVDPLVTDSDATANTSHYASNLVRAPVPTNQITGTENQ